MKKLFWQATVQQKGAELWKSPIHSVNMDMWGAETVTMAGSHQTTDQHQQFWLMPQILNTNLYLNNAVIQQVNYWPSSYALYRKQLSQIWNIQLLRKWQTSNTTYVLVYWLEDCLPVRHHLQLPLLTSSSGIQNKCLKCNPSPQRNVHYINLA